MRVATASPQAIPMPIPIERRAAEDPHGIPRSCLAPEPERGRRICLYRRGKRIYKGGAGCGSLWNWSCKKGDVELKFARVLNTGGFAEDPLNRKKYSIQPPDQLRH